MTMSLMLDHALCTYCGMGLPSAMATAVADSQWVLPSELSVIRLVIRLIMRPVMRPIMRLAIRVERATEAQSYMHLCQPKMSGLCPETRTFPFAIAFFPGFPIVLAVQKCPDVSGLSGCPE